jgi:hypothetical protein
MTVVNRDSDSDETSLAGLPVQVLLVVARGRPGGPSCLFKLTLRVITMVLPTGPTMISKS